MVANCKTDQDKVFSAYWKNETEFATCGVKHMQVYSQTGQNIAAKRCTYLTQIPGTGVMMTCLAYLQNGDLISGVSTGQIVKWNGTQCGNPLKAHTTAVRVIELGLNDTFWTAGNEGRLL